MRFDKQDIRLLNLYDFGARMFSPFNMRWMTMDPLAEKYYHISPYVYCAGGPINIVDPDGRHLVVTRNENNQYIICCGQMNDDLNIYEFYLNDSMEWKAKPSVLWLRKHPSLIVIRENGLTVYASARDVGNMAAGYVAGLNGLSWSAIRFGADLYQSYQASFKEHRIRLNGEGMTTTNAQFYGWRMSGRDTWNKGLPR